METKPKSPIISEQLVPTSGIRVYIFFIILGVFVLAEILVGGFIGNGIVSRILTNASEMPQLTKDTIQLEQTLSVVDSLDSGKIGQELSRATTALPSEKKVSGIVSSLTSLASASGVVVNKLELTPCKISTRSARLKTPALPAQLEVASDCENVKLEKGVSGVPLTMQVLTSEAQLVDFVGKLHLVSPLLGVKNLEYTVSPKGKMSTISLLLFFQPSTADLTKTDKLTPLSNEEENVVSGLSKQIVILP